MNAVIGFGVCRLSVVPVRKEADQKSEQVTQLLFGDHYMVTENSKDSRWLRIRVHADDYTGWIEKTQHHAITQEYFEQINLANFKITTDVASTILYKKSSLTIVMGSIVPISGSELFKMEEQFAFNGETKSLGQRRDYEFLKSIAMKYLHCPQQAGGKSPFGIDGDAFVQMVMRIAGYSLPREASQQFGQGRRINDMAESAPGDLAFFKSKEGKINHVGIVLEEQKVIHCFGRVRIDYLMEEGILNPETKIYTHTLGGLRRIIN